VLEALADKPAAAGLPLELIFSRYVASCTQDELLEMSRGVAAKSFNADAPELPLVLSSLPEHAADLSEAILKL
jgi:hypothetical protein